MKVYILMEEVDIVGVWSSRKGAEDFANDPRNSIRNWFIQECEVKKWKSFLYKLTKPLSTKNT